MSKKIRKKDLEKSDKEIEKEALEEDNFSILMLALIIGLCFFIGIGLGFALYKLAINSSVAVIFTKFV